MHSEGKPMTGPMIIEKLSLFNDEIKITNKCTFSKCRSQSFTRPAGEGDIQMEYFPHLLCSPILGAVMKKYL